MSTATKALIRCFATLVLSVVLVSLASAPNAFAADEEKGVLVILNFKSDFDSGDLGQRAAYSLRAKLRRSEFFSIPDELDFDEVDSQSPTRPSPADAAMAQRLAAPFAPRFIVYGQVTEESGFTISLSAVDLDSDSAPIEIARSAPDLRAFALVLGDIADSLAREFAGRPYRVVYPSKSTDGFTRIGASLVSNGDFESGTDSPDAWQKIDRLCSFWDSDEAHGRFMRFNTDVNLDQWREWQGSLAAGAPLASAPDALPTVPPKYDTVAGTYGVAFYSDPIPVNPGVTYSIEFDAKGLPPSGICFPKVFVKGYGPKGPTQEFYNMYKSVRLDERDRWMHFSRIFHPTDKTPDVVTMRVMLFPYWPPGEYAFDNVEIYEVVPSASAPTETPPAP